MDFNEGVTRADEAFKARGEPAKAWNVVGHTYTPKALSDRAFVWHAHIPAGTFVPHHIHPTQDEWITMMEGELEIEFAEETVKAGPGDVIRLPMGTSHGIFNRGAGDVTCVFCVAPSGRLYDLFEKLDGVTDPETLVRISAEHEVEFLPPPA